ncbi:uncharacterized protein [Oscarella lobularis]|uniref:uncharacterized protein n=1 Tax=Oscarella lobularis TaxID=121494 RepID=UPI0033141A05
MIAALRFFVVFWLVSWSNGTFPNIESWNEIMQHHVSPGQLDGISLHVVDYEAMRNDSRLEAFLTILSSTNTSSFDRNETYAFFMNAYNALAINMIIQHPCTGLGSPIKSILDIGSLNHSVWKMNAGIINGKEFSLDDVEDYLRNPQPFKEDPRLHACIVCASISCPNVRTEAYVPERVHSQMSNQMRDFLSNTKKGMRLDKETNTLTLSPIFLWFIEDFYRAAGSVENFIFPYISSTDAAFIKENSPKKSYFKYNWNVNGKPPCNC